MPRRSSAIALVAACILTAAAGVSAATDVLEMHGSGTTNPSKFFWKVMDLLEERSAAPIKMTYRAVGASIASPEPRRARRLPSKHHRPDPPPHVLTFSFSSPPPAE